MLVLQVREELRKLRAGRGWTQKDLARKAGVEVTTIHRIENTKGLPGHQPDFESIEAIAKAFGFTLSEFFLRIEDLNGQEARGTTVVPQPNPKAATHGDPVPSAAASAFVPDFVSEAILTRLADTLAERFERAIDRLIAARQQVATPRDSSPVRDAGDRKIR